MLLQFWLAIPLAARLGLLWCLGLALGGLINWAIYSLAWNYRPISPWSAAPAGLPRRTWLDRAPLLGWWRLRRERRQFGTWFWLRPLLLEAACGAWLPLLYWWETVELALVPDLRVAEILPQVLPLVHLHFAVHVPLLALLITATFIDFDEKLIPDAITVTGTLLGLLLAGLLPTSLPPDVVPTETGVAVGPVLAFVRDLPRSLEGSSGLAAALGIVAIWCFALHDKTCTLRHGFVRGCAYLLVSTYRRRSWVLWVPVGLLVMAYVTAIWYVGGLRWWALLSSLLGLGFGGGIVWGVRAVGGWALQVEAMGFGDVTLMAMVGTFLGWQSTVIVFFLAPLTAVLVALAQWIFTGRPYIAFGPYISLAATLLIVAWHRLWTEWAREYFQLGWLIAATVVVCLVLMGAMLWIWREFRERVLYRGV